MSQEIQSIVAQKTSGVTSSQAVIEALTSELVYQDSTWNEETTVTKNQHTPLEFLVFMKDYAEEAQHLISRNAEQKVIEQVASTLRKVATMGFRTLHNQGQEISKPNLEAEYSFNEVIGVSLYYINKAIESATLSTDKGTGSVTLIFINEAVAHILLTMEQQNLAPTR